ncbi:hypothetical protein F0562_016871 [Nyssa sinensis]|uniref:Tubulin/FtsZ GTPase domain-containing protein n=1 Tax=Nyssa sinensis TaxID=561372 RepID=A0A5J4ZDB5_9ASTE|nr:hypothetical protein F0562_016871 [Nyssa sinensis]
MPVGSFIAMKMPDGQIPSDKTLGEGNDAFNTFFSKTGIGIYCSIQSNSSAAKKTQPITSLEAITPLEEIVVQCLDCTRKLAEKYTGLQGFLVFHAVGGGTISGLGSSLLERLSVDYGKKSKFGLTVYPLLRSQPPLTTVFCPLILSSSTLMLLFFSTIRPLTAFSKDRWTLKGLIVRISSGVTAEKAYQEQLYVAELTNSAFEPLSMMAKYDPQHGKVHGMLPDVQWGHGAEECECSSGHN